MSLNEVDWTALPEPARDGKAAHLTGMTLPDVTLPATEGADVTLSSLLGTGVIFCYPMTGRPDRALPEGWDMIPGARGCTPQACAYRDLAADLSARGVDHIYGISTQTTAQQIEAATRLHLPFALLSDEAGELAAALDLPVMEVEGKVMLKRLTMIVQDGKIVQVHYPVFPPDQDAPRVIKWLEDKK